MPGVDSSKVGSRADLENGQPSSSTWRPSVPTASHPPTSSTASGGCSTIPAPPRRNVSQQYNRICKTHKKLVKTGAVQCSISLSDTPPTVNLPSAPSSPVPDLPPQEASVHWGAVGEFSGVQTPYQTPDTSPTSRPSVIRTAPPALPPRLVPLPPALPPRPAPRQQLLPSPSLLEGISALLEDLQTIPDTPVLASPTSDRESYSFQLPPLNTTFSAAGGSRLSTTDPKILQYRKSP